MTILEFPSLGGRRQRPVPPHALPGGAHPARPVGPAQDGLQRFQLRQLINEMLADPDLDPGIYFSLLEHLAENPGHPEQALLAHLRDVQDAADLPPYKSHSKPAMPPAEP
jgi:hypothetical protein